MERKPRQSLQDGPLSEGQVMLFGNCQAYDRKDKELGNDFFSEEARKHGFSPKALVKQAVFVPLEGRYAGRAFRIDRYSRTDGKFRLNRSKTALYDDGHPFACFRFALVNINIKSFTSDHFRQLLEWAAEEFGEQVGESLIVKPTAEAKPTAVITKPLTLDEIDIPEDDPAKLQEDTSASSMLEGGTAAKVDPPLPPSTIELLEGQVWVTTVNDTDQATGKQRRVLGEVRRIKSIATMDVGTEICFSGVGNETIKLPTWRRARSPNAPTHETRPKQPAWVGSARFIQWIINSGAQLASPKLLHALENSSI